MSSVDSLSSATAQIMDHIDLGPTGSLSLQYAKLQLAQSEIAKNQANDMMDKIQQNQADQQKIAGAIEEARTLQKHSEELKDKDEDDFPVTMGDGTVYQKGDVNLPYGSIAMTPELKAVYDEFGLDATSGGDAVRHDGEEWDALIMTLTNYQETLSTSTQTDMVLLQDYMAQYNSYIQGASKAINDATQTLQSVITR